MARYRRRKGRQTHYRGHRINWGRFIVFLLLLAAIAAAIFLLIKLFSGDVITPNPRPQAQEDQLPEVQPITPIATPEPPEPELPEGLTVSPASSADPANYGFETGIQISGPNGKSEPGTFSRAEEIRFGKGSEYTSVPGILTFAGNNYRDTFVYGTQTLQNKTLTRIWEQDVGSLYQGGYSGSGTGWTGQPLIVQWPEETRKVLGIKDEFKNMDGFTEVIYPTMDGKIYFLELESGRQTRDPIKTGVITKGTGSIDPRGYPLLYTGQGIPDDDGAWVRIVDLIENKVIYKFGGKDPYAHREFQAYDSSPLVDAESDTLIYPSENGILYTLKLNSQFDPEAGTVSVDPQEIVKYRYWGDGYTGGAADDKRWPGIENSIAVWRNYGYFTDNGGRMQCVDLNTLELQFVVDVTDDSDASSVLEEDPENNTFYLYTSNEVDKQEGAARTSTGKSYHRKINGLTGEVVWEKEHVADYGGESSNGGTLTTAHVGRGKLSNMVIYNATRVPVTFIDENGQEKSQNIGGRIIAYDKVTGEELWRFEQASGYWASPVVVYDKDGNGYIIQCDRLGRMRIQDPMNGGAIIAEVDLGSKVESTPAVFGDYLVVGTRGNGRTDDAAEGPKIIGVKIG